MPLNIFQDKDGLPRIILTEPKGSSAEVLLYGGQIISWKNHRKEELLFMSSKANKKQHKAIRGGISACLARFGDLSSLEQHGFARNRMWSLDRDPSPLPPLDNQSSVDLILKSTEVDLKTPCSFEFRLRISLNAGKLILIPRVRNTANKAFSFSFTLCNYLSVSDISEVRIEGLETLDYFDNLLNRSRFTEQADALTFDGEWYGIPGVRRPRLSLIWEMMITRS
uniref:Glucose-6-phosphate 1-epimerase n=1 Tax=Glycine max TaxID=3847 RepID=A0A0R0EHC5_SOYBN